jgi:tape measure domain-containing protein
MSKTIDERVVEMRFDNKNFENNVKTSMSTIDKLKQSLRFTGATKGLENVSNEAKKVDMSGLSKAVETVQMRFSSLDVIAVTALTNITNAALNAGKNLVKSLTIDPVKTGFQEYETQLNAVQTILANTSHAGTDIEDVNKALDELNKYADQTIYNFTEMTRNVGTFTAAGVDLDKSVTSIKGIANLAAVSGSTAQQASTAMYQLSQALAAGKVSLMDWNSIVNAGMGGKVFRDALKRTAEHFGFNVDSMIAKYGSFRESLTEGNWLTAEVLTETLTQLSGAYSEADLIAQGYSQEQAKAIVNLANTADDAATKVKTFTQLMETVKEAVQSGWAQSWEIILGDFEEAKEFFTGASDMIGKFVQDTADARNSLLEAALSSPWKKFSKEITAAGVDIEDLKNKALELGKKYGKVTDEMIENAGSFEKSLKEGWLTTDIVSEVLRDMAGGMSGVSESTEDMTKKLDYFQDIVHDVWMGDYKNGKERIEALTKAGYDYATVQDLVNKTVDGHKLTLEDLNVKQAANLGFTKEQIEVLGDLADQAEKTERQSMS